jgi:hypothetical protein
MGALDRDPQRLHQEAVLVTIQATEDDVALGQFADHRTYGDLPPDDIT